MNIFITSATPFEVQPLKEKIAKSTLRNIHFHTSGVGILQSVFSIQKLMAEHKPEVIIQIGIAGTFDEHCVLGETVVVKNDMQGSCGVEENDEWKDIFDLNLSDKNAAPFNDKWLLNPWLEKYNQLQLKEVNAITIDEITTNKNRIVQLKNKYNPFLESMEGAPFHYCALQYGIAFLQIRSISNYTGERDKTKWKIKEAIQNVCEKSFELISKLKDD